MDSKDSYCTVDNNHNVNCFRPDDVMTVSECLQMMYHRSLCHHLLLLYPRDILLIDLHINQTVGIVSVEKAMSPLVQVSN